MGGHLQTIYSALTMVFGKFKDQFPHSRTLVPLADGGQISVDWTIHDDVDSSFTDSTPVIAILPGLTGDRYDDYMKALIEEVVKQKYKCAIINHRGCSRTPLTSRIKIH